VCFDSSPLFHNIYVIQITNVYSNLSSIVGICGTNHGMLGKTMLHRIRMREVGLHECGCVRTSPVTYCAYRYIIGC
jgi:hypothetical protein